MKRFQEGHLFKVHRLVYLSILDLGVIKKKKKKCPVTRGLAFVATSSFVCVQGYLAREKMLASQGHRRALGIVLL